MDNNGVKIKYGDVAPEAKENFVPTVSEKADFVDLEQLQRYNLQFPNYANPCEYGSVLLDGTSVPFPDNPQNENMGLWSTQLSGADGSFETPIVLTLATADYGQYSSQGFTFTFDTYNSIFCDDLNIKWYRYNSDTQNYDIIKDDDGNDLDIDFSPDSALYFCRRKVENFNKVVITFKKINMPYNRLKLRVIDFGYTTYFNADELRSVNVIQELNPISAELSTSTVDFVLDSNSDMDYSFQSKQPLEVYFNGVLRAVTFVTSSKRQSKNMWSVESEDYIGQLSRLTFLGDIYSGKNAGELLTSIFTQAKVPFEIDELLAEKTVSGHIPICDCREAVRQICFAIGAVCKTANEDKVVITVLDNNVRENIPLSRIRQGQSFEDGERVTQVKITSHNFTSSLEKVQAYTAEENGTGENIFVQFSDPLTRINISGGEIIRFSANYAVINATDDDCVLSGYKYRDEKTEIVKNNPLVLASELDNVVSIEDATLVTKDNAESILNSVYDYVSNTITTKLKINEGKRRVKFGDCKYGTVKYGQMVYDNVLSSGDIIQYSTEYLGDMTGRIISQRYNLNGGIVVKECEVV